MAKKTKLEEHPIETFYPSEIVEIDSLKPWATNYNQHDDRQLSYMRGSLRDFGQFKNVVAWGDYIVAGHGLVEAAKGRGWKRIEVKRLPADWTETQVESVLIADNRLAQLSTPDETKLADMLQRVRMENATLLDSVGYNTDEIDAMLRVIAQEGEPAGEIDPNEHWVGMPEFEHEDLTSYRRLIVHFKDQDAVDSFAEMVGQTITDKTKFLWYPEIEIIKYGIVEHQS